GDRAGPGAGRGRGAAQPVAHHSQLHPWSILRQLVAVRRRHRADRLSNCRISSDMSENDTSPSPSFSRRKIAIGAIAAAVAASAAVLFVLPAVFGIDPTGFGREAGLTGLAPAGDSAEDNIYLQRGLARTNVLMPLPEGAA